MKKDSLSGKRIAFLATDGVEQVELTEPKKNLEDAGATTEIISPKSGEIKAWKFKEWGDKLKVDKSLDDADPEDYDALVLPGGVINPDHLRMEPKAVQFVKDFARTGRTIAAICHGPWTLIEAGLVRGKKMTSWPSLKTDLKNAGATWVDEPVVKDGNLVTSRKPDDIDTFSRAIMDSVVPIGEAEPQRLRAAS
ncbi:MAG TPA: type 1 glutamine amidotransferase domain-containing protein [Acidobacteriaceae bacterium]|jgi:protease I|nr:type 1 glutamine amidotransferase domain-containing protein [Acidobacteriaceae bacterium]